MDDPWSRPPGAKNMKTLVTKALNELVVVTENGGGRRKVSKREAIITQLVNRSAKADFKAVQILLGLLRDIEGDTDPHTSEPTFTEADQQIINACERGCGARPMIFYDRRVTCWQPRLGCRALAGRLPPVPTRHGFVHRRIYRALGSSSALAGLDAMAYCRDGSLLHPAADGILCR